MKRNSLRNGVTWNFIAQISPKSGNLNTRLRIIRHIIILRKSEELSEDELGVFENMYASQ